MSKRDAKERGLSGVSGLGMGAAALAEVTGQAVHRIVAVKDVQIIPGFNPRGQYDPEAFNDERLSALSNSIRAEGLLTPLWVRAHPEGGYTLIAGERRFRAVQIAGISRVPVLVFQADDRRAVYLAVLENSQRENLSIVDETFAGFQLLEAHTGLPVAEVVALLNQVRKGAEDLLGVEAFLRGTYGTGVSLWSQNRARILEFTPEELAAVREQRIDVSVVYELVPLKDHVERGPLLQQAIGQSLNATQVRALVKPLLVRKPRSALKEDLDSLRSVFPRLARLKGSQADRARQLIQQMQALLDDAS